MPVNRIRWRTRGKMSKQPLLWTQQISPAMLKLHSLSGIHTSDSVVIVLWILKKAPTNFLTLDSSVNGKKKSIVLIHIYNTSERMSTMPARLQWNMCRRNLALLPTNKIPSFASLQCQCYCFCCTQKFSLRRNWMIPC